MNWGRDDWRYNKKSIFLQKCSIALIITVHHNSLQMDTSLTWAMMSRFFDFELYPPLDEPQTFLLSCKVLFLFEKHDAWRKWSSR